MFENLLKFLEQVKNFIIGLIFILDKHQKPSVPIDVFEPKEEDKKEEV
jgi:hypothetical protein